eukprot:9189983-Alexandrium_andersonii.AAC.1
MLQRSLPAAGGGLEVPRCGLSAARQVRAAAADEAGGIPSWDGVVAEVVEGGGRQADGER